MLKLKFIIPTLMIICGLVWWLMPHFSDQDKGYYVALYCLHPDSNDADSLKRLQQLVEGNNQDYALKKRHYSPQLAEHILAAWHSLSAEQQQQAQQREVCRQQLSDKLMITLTH